MKHVITPTETHFHTRLIPGLHDLCMGYKGHKSKFQGGNGSYLCGIKCPRLFKERK